MVKKDLCAYNTKTINELIKVLEFFKKELGGNTKVHLSDFEFNGKQTQFEVCRVQGCDELYLMYEMHEDTWY